MEKIRVLVCRVGQEPVVEEIELTLTAMQKLVGGYLERLILDHNIDLWCNEDGLRLTLKPNCVVAGRPFVGDIFFARTVKGKTSTLRDSDLAYLKRLLNAAVTV